MEMLSAHESCQCLHRSAGTGANERQNYDLEKIDEPAK